MGKPGKEGLAMWMDLWESAQSVKIYVWHINSHQTASTLEQALNNQVIMDNISPSAPAISLSSET